MPVFFTHIEPVMVVKKGKSGELFFNHFHPEAEIKYVLDGGMRVRSADRVYDLGKGDIYIAFPFEEHSFENLADSVIMTVIFAPEDVEPFGKQLCRYMPVYPVINVSDLAPGFGESLCRTSELWSRLKCAKGAKTSAYYSEMLTDPAYNGGTVGESSLRAYLTAEVGEAGLRDGPYGYYFSRMEPTSGFQGWMDEIRFSSSALPVGALLRLQPLGSAMILR